MIKSIGLSFAVLALALPALVGAQTATTGLLQVYVQVINQNAGAYSPGNFQVQVSGNSPSPSSFAGSNSGTLVVINPGAYSVTVANQYGFTPNYSVGCNNSINANQTQLCVVTMSGSGFNPVVTPFPNTQIPAPLSCRTETPQVGLGQSARFVALGGMGGTYNWNAAGSVFANIGPFLTTSFHNSGTHVVTVTSGAQTAACTVNVTNIYQPMPGTTSYTSTYYPSFPNTGVAPSVAGAGVAFAVVLLVAFGIALQPYARKAFATALR